MGSCESCKNFEHKDRYCKLLQINWIPENFGCNKYVSKENGGIDNAPAVESDRPQGVWMPVREEAFGVVRFRCSNCGFEVYCPASQICNYKGCFCGAEMEMTQNEID